MHARHRARRGLIAARVFGGFIDGDQYAWPAVVDFASLESAFFRLLLARLRRDPTGAAVCWIDGKRFVSGGRLVRGSDFLPVFLRSQSLQYQQSVQQSRIGQGRRRQRIQFREAVACDLRKHALRKIPNR